MTKHIVRLCLPRSDARSRPRRAQTRSRRCQAASPRTATRCTASTPPAAFVAPHSSVPARAPPLYAVYSERVAFVALFPGSFGQFRRQMGGGVVLPGPVFGESNLPSAWDRVL
eukprot:583357-Rhodomonas_salina.4